jgi:tetratricopeptide (TPR) repeat protein
MSAAVEWSISAMTESINNRYLLHGMLGEGAMGVVYRATDRLTGRPVALKRVYAAPESLLFNSRSAHEDVRLALAREFQALSSLRHPNIISVLDYGFTHDHIPFFTMELLEDRRTIIQAGSGAALEVKIDLLVQLLRALVYVHRQGILHRDLKPGNVLVCKDPVSGADVVKVLDFGLSIEAGEARGTLGTLPYMAPEVLAGGDSAQFGVDLYAVGVLAYQYFVGHYPFRMDDIENLIADILHTVPNCDAAELPPGISAVLSRLLEKAPENRYADASAVIRDLRAAVAQPVDDEDSATRESILQAAKFVGRGDELRQLTGALDRAARGNGSFWLIGGESGVGKSRLLDEIRTRALVRGITVLRGQAVEGGALLYQLWRGALRQALLSIPVDDLEAGTLKPLVPDIAKLLERPIPAAPIVGAEAARQRLITTIVRIFRRLSGTTLLILEDLQWAHESLEPLKLLSAAVGALPLLILASYRHEERRSLPNEFPEAQLIQLGRLNTDQIAALSTSMLGDAGRRPDVIRLLEHESEGNVFFLVEVVRALSESAGGLRRVGEIALPERVLAGGIQALVRRRLERVALWGQPLLQRAAVGGRLIDLRLLERLTAQGTSLEGHRLNDWLTNCANAAVLEYREGGWRFAHDKLREILLDSLGDERPALHREVAGALEALHPDDSARTIYAEALLDHWRRAGEPEKELHYVLIAAEQAVRLSGIYRAAQAWLEHALSLIDAGEIADGERQRMKLLKLLADAHSRLAQYPQATECYQASMALAARLDDPRLVIANLTGLAEVAIFQANFDQARRYAESGLTGSSDIDDRAGIARCLQLIGQIDVYKGEWANAREQFTASLALYQTLDQQPEIAGLLNNLGTTAVMQGDFATAKAYFEQSYAIAQQIGDRHRAGVMLHNLAQIAADQADIEGALDKVREAARLFRELGNRQNLGMALNTHGSLLLRQGSIGEAQRCFHESLALRREINDRGGAAATQVNLGVSRYLQGDYAGGEALLSDSLAFFAEANNRRGHAETLRNLGMIALAQADVPLARSRLTDSAAQFEALDDMRGVVLAFGGLVMVHAASGEFPEARALLARAVKLALELELPMPKIKVLVSAAALALPLGYAENAARWIGMILNHPATIREDFFIVHRLLIELEAHLDMERLTKMEDAGASLDLDAELAALSAIFTQPS